MCFDFVEAAHARQNANKFASALTKTQLSGNLSGKHSFF